MSCLTKEKIVSAPDLIMEKVLVPEWADGDAEAYVMVRALTAKEKAVFEESVILPESKGTKKVQMDMVAYGPKLALISMCDDSGEKLFTVEDAAILEGKSAKALERVVRVAMKLNGITNDAVETEAKNS